MSCIFLQLFQKFDMWRSLDIYQRYKSLVWNQKRRMDKEIIQETLSSLCDIDRKNHSKN